MANSFVIVPVEWKLPILELLRRKEETANQESGAKESETFCCVLQNFYITFFNYDDTLHAEKDANIHNPLKFI